ncbi:Gfo/Idh/MocA family protein [Lachnoclostridium phytofermentans]|uniref:Oxidoreductase domain protein n=1 Tax=Lachnoclostridium phytofermentans (strain ATCC 700394 / DSM 18823 / ISDg) TaxID=357809 RepID=A9KMI3_LACP7|nr:Gfo/Idh/MocA family oxidoreductase [Lachnoclostridium phytofermentans]ABX41428.1 oxidoreductase domain protein [Lachnoclostridium phytofermentans ISDg]
MNQNTKVRIALIGVGSMGKKYATMLDMDKISNLTLTAVCCRSKENQSWVKENLSESVKLYPSSEELFAHHEEYDAVLIVTPHKQHPGLAIKAFELKKHVFCDKPAGVSLLDAQRMEQAQKESGCKYAMMFHNRTYPVLKKVKQLLDDGFVGELKRIQLVNTIYYRTEYYHQSGDWRSSWHGEGGGALINQGQHILDYWQWLFGMPYSIYASIPFGKYNSFAVDDEATLLMEYPNKVTATFLLSTGEIPKEEVLTVVGTKGCIKVTGNEIELTCYSMDSMQYGKTAKTNSREEILQTKELFICNEPKESYEQMLVNFGEAILRGKALIAPGEEGTKALELTNAAYLSACLGERVILPIDSTQYEELLKKMIENEKVQ